MKKAKILDWISFFCLVGGIAAFIVYTAKMFEVFLRKDGKFFWLSLCVTLCDLFELFMLGIAMFPLSTKRQKKFGISFAVVLSVVSGILLLLDFFRFDYFDISDIRALGLYVWYDYEFVDGLVWSLVDSEPLYIIFRIVFGGILLCAFLKKRKVLSVVGFSGWFIVRWVNLLINSLLTHLPSWYHRSFVLKMCSWIIVTISLLLFFIPRFIVFLKRIRIEKMITRQKDLSPEERLTLLKEYADKGYIDPEAYAKKRQKILESL